MYVTTFVGKGKDITTILGGIGIDNVENTTFKNMTVTNTNTSESGCGIQMRSAKVELFDVALKGCGKTPVAQLNQQKINFFNHYTYPVSS